MLIFRINDALPKLRVKTLRLPDSTADKEAFRSKVAHYVAEGMAAGKHKLDIL